MSALAALSLPSAVLPAGAASVSAASFTGDNKTLAVDGLLYAKQGAALSLAVTTESAKCVVVAGDHSRTLTSSGAKTSWSFTGQSGFTTSAGDGVKTVTVTAYDNLNCTNNVGTGRQTLTASYVLDNTGPAAAATLSPAANAAGWNKSAPVTVTWDATDSGVGFVKDCDGGDKTLNPCTASVTGPTSGTTMTASAIDRLGNEAKSAGSVTVKVDTGLPTISGGRTPATGNAFGWNNTNVNVNFSCLDTGAAGIKSCGPNQTISTDGLNQSVTGKAIDVADNEASATVGGINVDKTAPVVTGAATTAANQDGWYKGDVAVAWTCTEALSGLNGACPGNSTIIGEGANLGATTASVSDKAGNADSGSVSGIKIDRTAPNTTATAPAPTNWNNTDVTVVLSPSDALSGVNSTSYRLDGAPEQTGTSIGINTDGIHTLEYWSADKAGNEEAHKTVGVKIDKTEPSINHTQNPVANDNGWNNSNVTVTFSCTDGGSGIASCTLPEIVATEGKDQAVTGTAVDNAGNTATDPATVSIDSTPPTITAAADRDPNANGWYNDDVTVSFGCEDALSGIDVCPVAQTLGHGADQSASGTATDAAGNSANAGRTGINIDKTAPTLSGATQGTPTNGWYNGDVTVAWSCGDALSGIDGTCPANSTVGGEGPELGASASVSDRAGNITGTTVGGIKIDRTAPSTGASVPAPKYNAWHVGSVLMTLASTDNLSQVDKTFYSVNGGAPQTYTAPFSLSESGTNTITFWSVDAAGNVEDSTAPGHVLTVQIDNAKPSITGSRLPGANGFGWNNGPVTVSFLCSDGESGVAGCIPNSETLSGQGAGQNVTGTAVDNVGNSDSATVGDINIDLTKPDLSGAATSAPNAADWYNGDVKIHWTAEDGLSDIDPATVPADSTITGEGSSLGVGPVSVSDKAGNTQSASVSGIKIDRAGPAITSKLPAKPASGWYSSDVTVGFGCSDPPLKDGTAGSGVASCPSAKLISGNGANQSVTSDVADDRAGNVTQGITVADINIDGAAPQSSADNQCEQKNGWCRGTTATVVISAADQTGLSGVKEIRYSVNGQPEQSSAGATPKSVVVPLNGTGTGNVVYYAVDNAGNVEPKNGVSLKWDNIAPWVTHTVNPTPNAAGWNKGPTVVHFDAKDDDTGSGVDPASVTPDVTVATDTAGRVVAGSADDLAGNRGTDSVTVKLDQTAPTISGAPTTAATGGWYTKDVTVHFNCGDGLSGVAVCPPDATVTGDGASQSENGTATDHAGNQASFTVTGINIDGSAPTVTVTGVEAGAIYLLGSVPTGGCTATDVGPSGIDANGCKFTVTGGQANGVGTFNYTATAKDVAGNVTTVTGSYTVRYGVTYSTAFWLQPINDTAHTTGQTTSVFKAGSTIPAKFRLLDANGKAIQTNTPPQWITPTKGSMTTAAIDEDLYSLPTTSGSTFTWNTVEQLYQFNWGSPKNGNGYFWRIGVRLDDGTTQAVNIGLR